MSGWTHRCCNGVLIHVMHGDMSGYVRIEDARGQKIDVPGCDLLKMVAEFVRSERYYAAEQAISDMDEATLLGVRRIPGLPCDIEQAKASARYSE